MKNKLSKNGENLKIINQIRKLFANLNLDLNDDELSYIINEFDFVMDWVESKATGVKDINTSE